MTTEVLRNMLYADSPDLAGLTAVVMDEIHYLADKFRGAVWEEVILHLAADVQVVGLSATVSNAEEFGAWLAEVRGERPWWSTRSGRCRCGSTCWSGAGCSTCSAGDGADSGTGDPGRAAAADRPGPGPGGRTTPRRSPTGSAAAGRGRGDQGGGRGPAAVAAAGGPPARVDVIERLDGAGLLPAITFIFSRAGCDAAVGAVRAVRACG